MPLEMQISGSAHAYSLQRLNKIAKISSRKEKLLDSDMMSYSRAYVFYHAVHHRGFLLNTDAIKSRTEGIYPYGATASFRRVHVANSLVL